eukprot:835520-Amphidinium_carterae.1
MFPTLSGGGLVASALRPILESWARLAVEQLEGKIPCQFFEPKRRRGEKKTFRGFPETHTFAAAQPFCSSLKLSRSAQLSEMTLSRPALGIAIEHTNPGLSWDLSRFAHCGSHSMPSAFSSSSASVLGVGWSGKASASSATASGTNPGSESVSASLSRPALGVDIFIPRPALGVDSVPSTLRPDLESRGAKRQHLPPVIWWRPGERQRPVTVNDNAEQVPFRRLWDSAVPEVELTADRPELLLGGCFAMRSQLAHVCFSQSGSVPGVSA